MTGLAIRADEHPSFKGGAELAPPKLERAGGRELVIIEVRVNMEDLHAAI